MSKPRKQKNGTFTLMVQFERRRKQLTLGRISSREANAFAGNIDRLVDCIRYGMPLPADLSIWVNGLGKIHQQQLVEIGLLSGSAANMTVKDLLGKFLEHYEARTDVTPSTKKKISSTLKSRVQKIEKRKLSEIEPQKPSTKRNAKPVYSAEATKILTDFNSWQRNFYAQATWSRDNKLLRSVGNFAVEHGYCDFNPFSMLPSKSMVNDERNQYIEVSTVIDVIESCLHPDTRLALALARFAAFRIVSEVRTLKWEHVDFENNQLRILDSKRQKMRSMPLFDNIREALEIQQEYTGTDRFVASSHLRQRSDSDNYNRIKAAIRRAGLKQWDRLRQNLRSSCENDLLELFPERMVTVWVGHTIRVSRDHYQKQRQSAIDSAIERARANGLMS